MLAKQPGEGGVSPFPCTWSPNSRPNLMRACTYNSHLMGFFYRTIRIAENGIKPAYVFDGKPPELKAGVVCVTIFSQHTTGLMMRAW